jgi:hypothetical protein
VLRFLHPEVEWNTAFAGVSFRGHLGLAQGWEWLSEAAEHCTVTLQGIDDLPDDRVLVVVERTLRARGSGLEVKAPLFSVVTLRDGLITRMDESSSRADALEAMELSE